MSGDFHNKDAAVGAEADAALRQALQALETPEPSAGFNARVLAAAQGRSPWRDAVLAYLRPALATAAASAVATLLLIQAAGHPSRSEAAPPIPLLEDRSAAAERARRALEGHPPTYVALQALRDSEAER